jgi:hypothetical protein
VRRDVGQVKAIRRGNKGGIVKEIPFEIKQQILQERRDNPDLTADMTDEEIMTLLQQSDLALPPQVPMSIRHLLNNSWEIIWKSKWIWFSSFMISVGSYLYSIYHSPIISVTLITGFFYVAWLLYGTIGLIYSIYCADSGEPVYIKRLWEVGNKSIARVLAINITVGISFGLCVCLMFYCAISISSRNSTSLILLIGLVSSAIVFLSSLASFTTMGTIIENLGVGKSIRKGVALFLHNIGFMFLVALIALGISLFITLVSVGVGWSLQSRAALTIISTIGTFFTTPFSQSLYVLAYLRFSEAEAAIQPSTAPGQQASDEKPGDVSQDHRQALLPQVVEGVKAEALSGDQVLSFEQTADEWLEAEEPLGVPDNLPLSEYLSLAGLYGQSGDFKKAARVLEQAFRVNPSWAPKLAGYQTATSSVLAEPVVGYFLLMKLAGKAGQREFALRFFSRMLDYKPVLSWDVREAARNLGIEKEARELANRKDVPWRWYE